MLKGDINEVGAAAVAAGESSASLMNQGEAWSDQHNREQPLDSASKLNKQAFITA